MEKRRSSSNRAAIFLGVVQIGIALISRISIALSANPASATLSAYARDNFRGALICVAFFLLLFRGALAAEYKDPRFQPVEAQVNLPGAETVELRFIATRHRRYSLDFGFLFSNQKERQLASAAAGEAEPNCELVRRCGTEIHFLVRIFDGDNTLLNAVNVSPKGHISFQVDRFVRRVLSFVVIPGRYRLVVSVNSFASELRSLSEIVEISTDPREADVGN